MTTTQPVIDFIFDFGSPNAYLASKVLPEVAERAGAKINLIPCLLGGIFRATHNRSPIEAFQEVKGKLAYEALEMRRFIAKHGLTAFRMNKHFPVNTLHVMRAFIAARHRGVGDAYQAAVSAAMWETSEKMDDLDVVRRVLDAAGLDGEALLAASQDPFVKGELVANTEAAVARGVFGSPTFFVGKEMFFGKARLDQVEEEAKRAAQA